MINQRIKVLLIAGSGRSGSTLIELILGNQNGYHSVGELRYIWEYLFNDSGICGCGNVLSECRYWTKIIDTLITNNSIDFNKLRNLSKRILTTPGIFLILFFPYLVKSQLRSLREAFSRIYSIIQANHPGEIIVDSSKISTYLFILLNIHNIDLRVLHLVRDSRAVVYSWKNRRKKDPSSLKYGGVMRYRSLFRTVIAWSVTNIYVSHAGRKATAYSVLRYENFARFPQKEINRVLEELDFPIIFTNLSGPIELKPTHSVGGNPIRFQPGLLTIEPDEEWKKRINLFTKWIVGLLTFVILKKYHYDLSGRYQEW